MPQVACTFVCLSRERASRPKCMITSPQQAWNLHLAAVNAKNYTATWLDHVSGCSCCLTRTVGVSACYLSAKGCVGNTTLSGCCNTKTEAKVGPKVHCSSLKSTNIILGLLSKLSTPSALSNMIRWFHVEKSLMPGFLDDRPHLLPFFFSFYNSNFSFKCRVLLSHALSASLMRGWYLMLESHCVNTGVRQYIWSKYRLGHHPWGVSVFSGSGNRRHRNCQS